MKRFTLASAAIAAALTASAQWNTGNTPVQIGTAVGTNSPIAALTSDGKMYISWRSSARVGDALCYSFPHLQLLDKDGKVLFGEKGLDISDHKSPSWNSTYSLAVTSDGCAIVSNADSRAEESEELERYNAFTPVWYKIDQNQDYVWGLDGLALTDRISSPFTDTFVVGDDVWIQDHSTATGEVNYFNRVSADGTLGFTEPLKIFGQVIQSIGSDFLTVNSGSDGVEVQRYTREGKAVWAQPAVVSSTIFGGHDLHPYKILSDGKGGVYITYVRNVGNFGHTIATQHVTADGDPTFGLDAMDALSDENKDIDYPKMAVDTKNNTALVAFAQSLGNDTYAMMVQKFNEEGDRLFGDDAKQIDIKYDDAAGWAFNVYGAQQVGEGEWLICYSDVVQWGQEKLYVARIDKDGNPIWKQQIAEDGEIGDVNFLKGDDCSYVVYKGHNEDDYSILRGARIYDDGTFEKNNTTALPYSIDFTAGKPADWAYLDKSTPASDYGHWAYGEASVKTTEGKKYMNCVFTGINFDDTPWNDYYISPEFKLDATKSYKVKSLALCDGESYKLTLERGTSLTDDATFTKFADCKMQKNTLDQSKEDEAVLKVDESGVYRIAFHVTSTAKSPTDNVYLFNFSIEEDKTSGIDNVSDNLADITSATIRSIDGKLVQTVKGGKFNSATLAPGMYIVTVKDAQGRTQSMKISK